MVEVLTKPATDPNKKYHKKNEKKYIQYNIFSLL